MAVENIEDITNITGLSKLLNKTHINEKIDPDALEKQILGGSSKFLTAKDPAKEFDKKMKSIKNGDIVASTQRDPFAKKGLKPVDDKYKPKKAKSSSSGSSKGSKSSKAYSAESSSASESEDFGTLGSGGSKSSGSSQSRSSRGSRGSGSSRSSKSQSSRSSRSQSQEEQVKLPSIFREAKHHDSHRHSSHRHQDHRHEHNARQPQTMYVPPNNVSYAPPMVFQQQPNTQNMMNAISAYSGIDTQLDVMSKEKEKEEISALLGDIGELRYELTQDEVNILDVPEVTKDSTLDEVKSVYNILKRRYERRRLNSLGTEGFIAIAQGLEYIFDGERKIGPYAPDLTNWHNTVRTKLRKMRYETSSVVGTMLDRFNVGSLGRIAIELVPSALLHSKMRKDSRGTPGYSTDQMSAAVTSLRDFE